MAFDPTAAMQAFAQAQLQQQREYFASRNQRRDISGNVIDPSTGKAPGNAFDTGFFKSPEQRQQIIDTRQVGMPTSADLFNNEAFLNQGQDQQRANVMSMPGNYQPNVQAFQMPPTFSVNDAQGQSLPGGPQWQGLPAGDPRAQQPQNYYPQAAPTVQPPKKPTRGGRTGSSFGFSASPPRLG